MADNDLKPMDDGDVTGSNGDAPRAAEPLKPAGDTDPSGQGVAAQAKQAFKDNAGKVQQQAGDRLRAYADAGKSRAGGALDDLSRMLGDAADQVDEKLGAQYGQYARSAAGQVQTLADGVRSKDAEELIEDIRAFVRASPAAAVGIAAAVGFAAARLIQAGIDADGSKHA